MNKKTSHTASDTHTSEHDTLLSLSSSTVSSARIQYRNHSYRITRHLHTCAEIYLIQEGFCYMNIGPETITCREGDFLLILPGTVHSLYLEDGTDCTFQHVHFMPDFFTKINVSGDEENPISLMRALTFACQTYFKQPADDFMHTCVDEVVNLHVSSDSLFVSANINLALMRLLLHIIELVSDDNPNTEHPRSVVQNTYVVYALDYIENNYMNKIYQQDIADALHISTRHLAALFKQCIGVTLSGYINIYRINRAIDMMVHTEESLTQIALAVGFKDAQHFSRVFTSIIDETPSRYRKLLREE